MKEILEEVFGANDRPTESEIYHGILWDFIDAVRDSGMSISELSELYGCEEGFMTRLLHGEVEVTLRTMARLQSVIGRRILFVK